MPCKIPKMRESDGSCLMWSLYSKEGKVMCVDKKNDCPGYIKKASAARLVTPILMMKEFNKIWWAKYGDKQNDK